MTFLIVFLAVEFLLIALEYYFGSESEYARYNRERERQERQERQQHSQHPRGPRAA